MNAFALKDDLGRLLPQTIKISLHLLKTHTGQNIRCPFVEHGVYFRRIV